MAETLRGGLSLGLSGFGFWSHDISGFIGTATPDLYKRWVAFGMLSSHSRPHGNDSPRMPWLYDEESVDVLRFFTRLKIHLMAYFLDVAKETYAHGWPMMRAMLLEFPTDPVCHYLDMQYMLGQALLVAPIFNASGEATFYLPEGKWRNLLTGETAQQVKDSGIHRVGLLGTRFTMEEDFYKGRLAQNYGLDVIIPDAQERESVHRVIYKELEIGKIRQSSRKKYISIIERLVEAYAEGVILRYTKIGLPVHAQDCRVRLFDTTRIHAEAAVNYTLAE